MTDSVANLDRLGHPVSDQIHGLLRMFEIYPHEPTKGHEAGKMRKIGHGKGLSLCVIGDRV